MKNITAVVAMGLDGEIGKNNKLLCTLKDDLRLFKEVTENSIVVMGRKTFESIGKPLPNRVNLILTRDESKTELYRSLGCYVMHSVDEALDFFINQDKNMFIIGGAEVYRQFLPYVNHLRATLIGGFFEDADTFFPSEYSKVDWELSESRIYFPSDQNNEYSFQVSLYERSVIE